MALAPQDKYSGTAADWITSNKASQPCHYSDRRQAVWRVVDFVESVAMESL